VVGFARPSPATSEWKEQLLTQAVVGFAALSLRISLLGAAHHFMSCQREDLMKWKADKSWSNFW
jgi:hypothetical protein